MNLINQMIDKSLNTIAHCIDYKVVSNSKLKKFIEVTYQNKKFRTHTDSTDILIEVNEGFFDYFNQRDETDLMLMEMTINSELSKVEYDTDKDILKKGKADFSYKSFFVQKHGYDNIVAMEERKAQIDREINDKD